MRPTDSWCSKGEIVVFLYKLALELQSTSRCQFLLAQACGRLLFLSTKAVVAAPFGPASYGR
jgi:hypothetical protein